MLILTVQKKARSSVVSLGAPSTPKAHSELPSCKYPAKIRDSYLEKLVKTPSTLFWLSPEEPSKITTPRLRHSPRRINGAGKRLIWKRFAPPLTMALSPSETGPGSVPCRASRQPGPSVRSLVGFYYEGVPCGPALPCDWFALLSLPTA